MTLTGWIVAITFTALVVAFITFYQGIRLGVRAGLEAGLETGVAYGRNAERIEDAVGNSEIKLTVELWGASFTCTLKENEAKPRFTVIRGGKA